MDETVGEMHNDEDVRTPQKNLKKQYLGGEIDHLEFLEELFKLDQEDIDRSHAARNSEILDDPSVAGKLETADDPLIRIKRLQDQALYEFHKAQICALDNDPNSLDAVNRAIALRKQAYNEMSTLPEGENEQEEALILYFRATGDYLQGDLNALQRDYDFLQSKDPDSRNTRIIRSLLEGLRRRGTPAYSEDYQP